MNLVLARLAEYDYWLHVEESWHIRVPEVPILRTLVEFMDSHTQVDTLGSQGGRGKDWDTLRVEEEKTVSGIGTLEFGSWPHGWCDAPGWTDEILRETAVLRDNYRYREQVLGRCGWGMFSLQPAITRSKTARLAGWFRPDLPSVVNGQDWSYRFQGQTPVINSSSEQKSVFWGVRWAKPIPDTPGVRSSDSVAESLFSRSRKHKSTRKIRGG